MTNDDSARYHERLVARDRTIVAELWQALHDPMHARFCSLARYRDLDPSEISDAIDDVIFDLGDHPERYNPALLSLDRYVGMAVRGDLSNMLQKRRRLPRVVSLTLDGAVEERGRDGNYEREVEDPTALFEEGLLTASENEETMRRLRDILDDPTDVRILEMIAYGVRDTPTFARVLSCDDRPIDEQRRLVKQAKDRIGAKLKRAGLRRPDAGLSDGESKPTPRSDPGLAKKAEKR